MARYECEYFGKHQMTRVVIVETDDERLIPFLLHQQDRYFSKMKKFKLAAPAKTLTPPVNQR